MKKLEYTKPTVNVTLIERNVKPGICGRYSKICENPAILFWVDKRGDLISLCLYHVNRLPSNFILTMQFESITYEEYQILWLLKQ